MKAKLMAVLMAVGLGVTGLAATAQAAENDTRAKDDCEHNFLKSEPVYAGASDYNESYHMLHYKVNYVCSICRFEDEREELEFEIHDYENMYDNQGHMIFSYCTVCNAKIYN